MSDNKLKSLAERIERLMDERDGIQSDIRDIYAEAKSAGYVPKVLRKAITRKRMDSSKRDEEDAILELYEGALDAKTRAVRAEIAKGSTFDAAAEKTGVPRRTVARIAETVPENKKSGTGATTIAASAPTNGSTAIHDPSVPHTLTETADRKPPGDDTGTGETEGAPAPVVAITESCGGVESVSNDVAKTRKTGNKPGSVPGEESSSSPSSLVGAAALGGHHKHPAGVAPGPQDPIDLTPPPFLDRRKVAA